MNWKDDIVEEVRAAREQYAARFGYDLAAMYADLKSKERSSGHPIADLQPAQTQPSEIVSPPAERRPA